MDYQSFVDGKRSLLIAPAGYGKTYSIVECLKYTSGRQLILTHTHAGVASIKEKIGTARINTDRYLVETISSFSQKYLKAFYIGKDIPEQDSQNLSDPTKDYHSFVIEKSGSLFLSPIIKQVVIASYDGLFVDEYQDCTKLQHSFILELAEILPTRIFGDPLQGIFDFNGQAVDFGTDLETFERFPDLQTPNRWYKEGNNKLLGDLIKGFRRSLRNGESISVSTNSGSGLYVIPVKKGDFEDPQSIYRKKITSLIRNKDNNHNFESLLIIVPEYTDSLGVRRGGISERAKILSKIDYSREVILLEAIDDKRFYSLAREVDGLIGSIGRSRKPIKKIYGFLEKLFCKTSPVRRKNIGLNDWISKPTKIKNKDYYLKAKQSEAATFSATFRVLIDCFINKPSVQKMYSLLLYLKSDLKLKVQPRRELLGSLIKSLNNSLNENVTVYESMKAHKNLVRRIGRKVQGKCIGTTLLTKGLEFDTVAIIDAHEFDSPKHLYVALTRCCNNLIFFTEKNTLGPFDSYGQSEFNQTHKDSSSSTE
jgi:hypothetical protein